MFIGLNLPPYHISLSQNLRCGVEDVSLDVSRVAADLPSWQDLFSWKGAKGLFISKLVIFRANSEIRHWGRAAAGLFLIYDKKCPIHPSEIAQRVFPS